MNCFVKSFAYFTLTIAALGSTDATGQTPHSTSQKPLTNDDVIAMVHKKLPESVIVSAIQAGPGKFNTSTNELIRMNTAGVTEKELNAMLGSGSGAPRADAAPAKGGTAQAADVMPASKSRMPRLTVTQGNSTQE